jgi:alpha-beta hydrolase superfamily lysophospholipase
MQFHKDTPWLKTILTEEFTADMLKTTQEKPFQWDDYLLQEEKLFNELQQKVSTFNNINGYRYDTNSNINPLQQSPNWNRTFVLRPKTIRGGIVMLHGLSDSPYSVRHLAHFFEQQGFLVIALRVPGHGTLPSGLLKVTWKDWAAATRLAMQEIQRELGDSSNIYLLGYSNGGTLALNYSLDALEDKTLPQPKKIILLSPMIGISRFAMLSKALDFISHLPLLGSHRWLSIHPEYNPFKYNSFSVNAAWQAHRFTKQLQKKIKRLAKKETLQHLPPVLVFQSVMDSTVKTAASERYFYRFLPMNNSELVLFDLNRHHSLAPIFKVPATQQMDDVFTQKQHPYNLVTISNSNPSTLQVSERRQTAGALTVQETPLELAFPPNVFSLSHVALPFPTYDSLYGLEPTPNESFGIQLGNLHLLGETDTLAIDTSKGMRLYSNPFFPYIQQRILSWLESP